VYAAPFDGVRFIRALPSRARKSSQASRLSVRLRARDGTTGQDKAGG